MSARDDGHKAFSILGSGTRLGASTPQHVRSRPAVPDLANCASADDDSLTLMSAEILPRLEGGIRAALEETDNQ